MRSSSAVAVVCRPRRTTTTTWELRAQNDAERRAPEVERAEIDVEVVECSVVLQVMEVPHVAANADVIGEVSHDPGADVDSSVVVADRVVGTRTGIDLRPQEPDANRRERTNAGALLPTGRYADNQIRHHVGHVVGPEDSLVAEET